MTLDMNQLRAFVTVAEARSFSKASQRLHRVQSAVSQQVQKLERQLGAEVFLREKSGLVLTVQGERLLNYAVHILALNDQAVSALTGDAHKGLVRVGTSDTYAHRFFSGILRTCAHRFPDIEVEVNCGYSSAIWQQYEAGLLDIVLTQGCPGSIASELLHAEPLSWICARGSRAATLDPLPLALFTQGCGDRDIVLAALNRAGIRYRIAYHSTSYAGIVSAVASGGCVSAVSSLAAGEAFETLGPADGLPALGNLDISLACHRACSGTPAHTLAEVIRRCFQALPRSEGCGLYQSAVAV